MVSLKGSLSFCSYPPITRTVARYRRRNAAHVRLLARVLALAIAMLENASPPVSVRHDRSIDQSCQSHGQRSRYASRLPQSPERPDQVRVDDPLFHSRGDSDCEVKDPENRLEHRGPQERPWVQGANEPQANFCGREQDADEHEGYADNPTSVATTWVSGTGSEGRFGEGVSIYLSVRLPWPSTSKTRIPAAMIVSTNKNICRIQRGVKVHELQVLRGYDMSGATIHDVQPWRTVAVDFCSFPGFSICPVFSIMMSFV